MLAGATASFDCFSDLFFSDTCTGFSALAFEVGEADSAGVTLVLAGVATSFSCFSVFSSLTTCAGASALAFEVGEADSAGATASFASRPDSLCLSP